MASTSSRPSIRISSSSSIFTSTSTPTSTYSHPLPPSPIPSIYPFPSSSPSTAPIRPLPPLPSQSLAPPKRSFDRSGALPYVQPTTLLSRILTWLDLPLASAPSPSLSQLQSPSHPSTADPQTPSDASNPHTPTRSTLLWLSGPPSSGKSLLARRIVDVCKTKPTGVVVLSYFFARDEGRRSGGGAGYGGSGGRRGGGVEEGLVSSLVDQLCVSFPGLRALVDRAQVVNPDIFAEPVHVQLQTLLFAPFILLHSHSSHATRFSSPRIAPTSASTSLPRLLLIIDALDAHPSSHSQVSLLYSLSYLLSTSAARAVPLLVIITSRRERHLKSAFRDHSVTPFLFTISLDRHRLPARDIRAFLSAAFIQLKNTHEVNQPTGDWPGDRVLDKIIAESEQGYLFPSLLIHHLLLSADPVQEVDTILQSYDHSTLQTPSQPPPKYNALLVPPRKSNPPTTSTSNSSASVTPAPPPPTSNVDSLLSHIFASIPSSEVKNTLTILSYVLLGKTNNPGLVCEFFGMDMRKLEGILEGLRSLVSISTSSPNSNTSSSRASITQNTIHPNSPPSYSSNSNRKTTKPPPPKIHFVHPCVEEFLMDRARSGAYHILSQQFANRLVGVWVRRVSGSSGCMLSDWTIISILRLLSHAKPTAQLARDLNAFQPAKIQDLVHPSFFPSFFAGVKALDFKDGGMTHTYHLHLIIPLLRTHAPQYLAELAKRHPLVMGIDENARLQPNRRSQVPPRYSPPAQAPHPSPIASKSKSKTTPDPTSHSKASTKKHPEPEPDPDPDSCLKPETAKPKKSLKDLTSRMSSNFTGGLNLKSHFNLSQVSLGSLRSRRVSQVGREG